MAIFTDIIKIVTMFTNTIFEDSKKSERIRNYLPHAMESTSVFLDIAEFSDFQWKTADFSRAQGLCRMIHIFFGSSLVKV